MSTSDRSKQRLIEVCYCSPNLNQEQCDYCMAKFEVSRILDVGIPEFLDNEATKQREIDETFKYYKIGSRARLNLIFQLEEDEHAKWAE